jgi:hypothetical protein
MLPAGLGSPSIRFPNTAEDCTSLPPTFVVRAPIRFPEGAGCKLAFPILMRLGAWCADLPSIGVVRAITHQMLHSLPTQLKTAPLRGRLVTRTLR